MKSLKLTLIFSLFSIMGLLLWACQENNELGPIGKPTGLSLKVEAVDIGTGSVKVSYGSSSGAITHKIVFSGQTKPNNGTYTTTINNGTFTEKYLASGTYKVIYYAYGTGGKYDSLVQNITVQVNYVTPQNIINNLTNGTSKLWTWDKNTAGHLGVGPNDVDYPQWYASQANEKPTCLYNDQLTFALNAAGNVTFTNANGGDTYIHVDHQTGYGQASAGQDACFAYTTGSSTVVFSDATSGITNSTKVAMTLGNQFLSYGLGTNTYEILSISPSTMYVRTVETAPDGTKRAWYQRFVSNVATCAGGATGLQAGTGTYQLVWADEFNTDGTPCANNWGYDIGTGSGGWGNNEQQYYTNRSSNVSVVGGSLKITATKESYMGSQYTSARLKSIDLFDFQYGKVEVRAKLPTEGGTWPAIWMLGSNIATVGWPSCGEIDIMEHKGNDVGKIYGTTHTLAGFGGSAVGGTTTISNINTFHIYSMEWTSQSLKFYVDNVLFYTYQPTQNANNWPFNNKYFLLLNFAMGGNFGGTISPAFTQSSMEVDYVRVYQK